jgi:hypothetical protein
MNLRQSLGYGHLCQLPGSLEKGTPTQLMSLTLSSDFGVVKWIPRVSPAPNLQEHMELNVQGATCCPQCEGANATITSTVIVNRRDIWNRNKKIVTEAKSDKYVTLYTGKQSDFEFERVVSKYYPKDSRQSFIHMYTRPGRILWRVMKLWIKQCAL